MNLDDNFKSAADRATKLPKRPPNDILLQLYALYKQGNEGDVTGDRPGFADFKLSSRFMVSPFLQIESSSKHYQRDLNIQHKNLCYSPLQANWRLLKS